MHKCFLTCVLAVVLLGFSTSSCALAQQADETVREAEAALQQGDYQKARRLYQALLDAPEAAHRAHALPYFETFLAVGQYSEGLAAAAAYLQRFPDDPYGLHAQGRLLRAVGRYEEAEQALRQAARQQPDAWGTLLALGELLEAVGRRPEAHDLYAQIYRPYQEGRFRTAPALAVAGRAASKLEQFHEANDAFRTAYRIEPTLIQNLYWWAELFREKYNDADAQRTYEEALKINPHHADLYVGLARLVNGFDQKEQFARQALEANPNSVDAINLLAELRIIDGLYEEAEELLQRALAINPASVQSMAHLASLHYLSGDTTAFEAAEARALEVNPRVGDFYITLVDNLTRRFRYPAAVGFGRRAVDVEPDNVDAYVSLGTSLLRVGETDEARRYLEASFERDPFNLFVGNTLTLLEEYADFDVMESPHFVLLIHRTERDVLGPAVLELAEAAYDSLRVRYPYTPKGKVRLEAYHDAGDFGVRIAGVPHLGLLGVSFGDVVAFNTPAAQSGRPYNWARTLWHEIAHTMAIGVSRHHVPRWLTEGLSVYEEQRARPEWGREMDLELFAAFDQGRLLPLTEIDRGFTRPTFPGQILLSYYHAAQVVGFIADQHGFGALTDLLSALGRGQDLEASFRQVLGQDLEAVDRAFRDHLRRERSRLARALEGLPDLSETEEEEPSLAQQMTRDAENPFFRRLGQGHAALQDKQYDAAEAHFLQALEMYPLYVEQGNPYEGLAAVYQARGEADKHIDILERFLQLAEHGVEEARTLGTLYSERGDLEKAIHYLRRSLEVEPYDLPTRSRLAALYAERSRFEEAARESRAVLALDPVDRADAYYQLALNLYHNRQVREAKRAVLQSLELAPGYRAAQKLLLQCVEAPQ